MSGPTIPSMTLGHPVLDALDKPGLRALLGPVVSRRRTRQMGQPVVMSRRRGQWTYSVAGRVLSPSKHGWVDPRNWDRQTQDTFFWKYQPKPGDTVLDIGAGIGTELFAYADRVGEDGRIYALEAHPATFERLTALYDLNKGAAIRSSVVLECLAASDAAGTVLISDTPNDQENSLVSSGGTPTAATTLDAFVAEQGIDRIDFLKMNIEGSERAALSAAGRTLSMTRNAAISCHDFLSDTTGDPHFRTKSFVRPLLLDAGFDVHERPEAADPWQRDYLYATRPSALRT